MFYDKFRRELTERKISMVDYKEFENLQIIDMLCIRVHKVVGEKSLSMGIKEPGSWLCHPFCNYIDE